MRLCNNLRRQSGVAAVELAVVTTALVVPLIICIWEMGRYIQVKQIVANGAREGARLAAQGNTIINATQVQIGTTTGTPNVQQTVYNYLYAAGLTNLSPSDINFDGTTLFAFVPASSNTQPYQGAMGQTFTVSVSIPWSKVRWANVGLINPTNVAYTVSWQMLVDNQFTINPNLPTGY